MAGTLAPNAKFTGLDDEGVPLVGGLLYTYKAGTSAPADTFNDVTMEIPNSNPVVLDAGGRATIYLAALSYKFVLKDRYDSEIWSQDDIVGVGSGGGSGGAAGSEAFVFGGDPTTVVVNPEYPTGSEIASLHSGTGLATVDSALLAGVYALEAMMSVNVPDAVVRLALVNLLDGDPDTPITEIQSSSESGELVRSGPITFGLPGTTRTYGVKVKAESGAGWAWMIKITRL